MDKNLIEVLSLSIMVSLSSLTIACFIGIPLGTVLAIKRFYFRKTLLAVINSLMGLPPVVVGLIVYLLISRSGPFGWLGILYSPTAMIIAQSVLIFPIITALSNQIIEELHEDYRDLFLSLNAKPMQAVFAYIYDSRYSLLTVILAGFGRALKAGCRMIIATTMQDNDIINRKSSHEYYRKNYFTNNIIEHYQKNHDKMLEIVMPKLVLHQQIICFLLKLRTYHWKLIKKYY